MKTPSLAIKQTSKFLAYVLGRHPDEFGLVPDQDGFVPVKELLKALHEEAGWRHMRQAQLNELLVTARPAPIEIDGNQIRAVDREHLPKITEAVDLPKVLYLAIRRKAYTAAIENGLRAGGGPGFILSSNKAMALRIGMRRDNQPVLLHVQIQKTQTHNVAYHQFGKHLFLTDRIPAGTFNGPAPPKPKPVAGGGTKKHGPEPLIEAPTPGSYVVAFDKLADPKQTARQRRQEQKERQKARRHARRRKKDRLGDT